MKNIEHRHLPVELRIAPAPAEGATASPVIEGYAAVFATPTDLGGIREVIEPGAFSGALSRPDDVRALWNHDSSNVLGRLRSGTLRLSEDAKGLRVEIDPPASAVRELEAIQRGDVDQMSFGFIVRREEWDETGDMPLRTIFDAELFDVSPVTFPAYPSTEVALRSLEMHRESHVQTSPPEAGEETYSDEVADDEVSAVIEEDDAEEVILGRPLFLEGLKALQDMIESAPIVDMTE